MTSPNHEFETGSSVLVNVSPNEHEPTNNYAHLGDETDALVAVTYDQSADSFLRTWQRRTGTIPEFVRVIEVGGTMRSAAGDSIADGTTDGDFSDCPSVHDVVETVEMPNDLDGVRAAIASALAASDGDTVLVFDSLTIPVEHVSSHEMIPFFHAISNLLADADAVGYFYCDEQSDISAVAPFRALVDETVELDEDTGNSLPHPKSVRDGPPLDVMFEALSSRRRRDALRYLLDTEGPVDTDELSTAVARLAPGEEELTDEQHRNYYSTLYQLHLPKLDSAGLIDHDERNNLVSIRDGTRWVKSFLALAEE